MKKALKTAAEKPYQQKIYFGIGLNILTNTPKTDPEISHDSSGASDDVAFSHDSDDTRDDVSDEHLPGDFELISHPFHPQISYKSTFMGGQNRSCQSNWFNKPPPNGFPWLH